MADELIGQVVEVVRPVCPRAHGAAWDALEAEKAQIVEWWT